MSEKIEEETISETDLGKSIKDLMDILDEEKVMEKSMDQFGTQGALAAEAGAPSLDPSLSMPAPEEDDEMDGGEPLDAESQMDQDHGVSGMMLKEFSKGTKESTMKKSETEGAEGADETVDATEEEFAKSLAEAFSEQENLLELTNANEFSKSLVLGTIEGLAIANTEMRKSLSEIEERNNAKIAVLAKGIAAVAKVVGEIRDEISAVSNSPARPLTKSVTKGAAPLEKSLGAPAGGEPLSKAVVLEALSKRVAAGKNTAFELVRFDSTGQIDPSLAREIQNELGS